MEAMQHSLEACPTTKASAESFHASAAGLKEGLWKTGKLAPLTLSFLRLQTQCSGEGCDLAPGSRLLGDPALDGRPVTDYTHVGASTTDPACPFLPSLPLVSPLLSPLLLSLLFFHCPPFPCLQFPFSFLPSFLSSMRQSLTYPKLVSNFICIQAHP